MKKLLAVALVLSAGCSHRFAAQLVLEPQESASAMSIGNGRLEQSTSIINPKLPSVENENRSLFAPGRSPF